jgi:hypothetical protein
MYGLPNRVTTISSPSAAASNSDASRRSARRVMVFMSDIVSDIGRGGKSLTRANDGLPAEARSGVWSAFAAAASVHRSGGQPSPGTRVKGRDLAPSESAEEGLASRERSRVGTKFANGCVTLALSEPPPDLKTP